MLEFQNITDRLIKALPELEETYRDEEKVERKREIFEHVRKATEEYFTLLDAWEESAHILSKEGRILVFPQQIDATKENMQALIMHSHYKDVRKRKYMEILQACHYIFTQSLEVDES